MNTVTRNINESWVTYSYPNYFLTASSAMIPKPTCRTCDYTIQRGHCQLQLC